MKITSAMVGNHPQIKSDSRSLKTIRRLAQAIADTAGKSRMQDFASYRHALLVGFAAAMRRTVASYTREADIRALAFLAGQDRAMACRARRTEQGARRCPVN